MNHELYEELVETSWQRKLTSEEEAELRAYLAAHPELQEEWEDELMLNRQLARLPDAPVASNFTAQVLHKLDLDLARTRTASRRYGWMPGWWRRWLPRYATAGLVILLGALGTIQYQEYRTTRLLENVLMIAPLAAGPAPEIYKDFDAIEQLRYVPATSDEDLLAALQLK